MKQHESGKGKGMGMGTGKERNYARCLLIQVDQKGYPIEIKLSQTFHSDFQKIIQQWFKLDNNPAKEGAIIYCGDHALNAHTSIPAVPWYYL